MAQTPNLKLNLFNGSDKPNYELFNDNNRKIDEVLNNAKTHNHDGVNSSKIKASNVVFNSGDTTLVANNLEDAVKEVFIEADNKISWITNAIGNTSSGVSNPDIKVDEIKADFDTARENYLNNVRNYSLFSINGSLIDSKSSINDISESISNTTFKEATATKGDMLTTAHGITKSGIVEYGTISPIEYFMAKPSSTLDVTINKGMYKQLYLSPFMIDNPALHIKKGCSILGIDGMLSEHGSNGWDIGDCINGNKIDRINSNEVYFSRKGNGAGTYSSIAVPITMQNEDGGFIEVQHFRIVNGNIECYTADMKRYITINFNSIDSDIGSSGIIQRNYITSKRMFKMFQQDGCLYAAIAYMKRVYIVELLRKKVMYKYPSSNQSNLDIAISEILIPNKKSGQIYNICFIGENGYIACQPVYNAIGTEVEKWKGYKRHSLDFRYTREENGSMSMYPKEITTDEQTSTFPTKVVKSNMTVEDGTIVLNAGDSFTISGYLRDYTSLELIYSVPFGGSQAIVQVYNDEDSLIEQFQTSSTATTIKTITIGSTAGINISCTQGKIKITGIKVAEVGYADTRNKLFSKEWGYLGGIAALNVVEVDGTIDEAYLIWGGHEKVLDEGKCSAIYSVTRFNALANIDNRTYFDLGEKLIVDNMYSGKDTAFLETYKIHKCLSFMSEYDGYIFGTFPDMRYIHSTVSVTGTRYHKYRRKLIKLNVIKSKYRGKVVLQNVKEAFEYRLFRPMFINYLGEVVGLEQGCTLEKFTYFSKLDNNLYGNNYFEKWSEDKYRTAEEEFQILDDGNATNKIRMLESVTRLYGTEGEISNTKLIGIVVTAPTENSRSTQASMSGDYSDISVSYGYEHGLLSVYNPIYRINGIRE